MRRHDYTVGWIRAVRKHFMLACEQLWEEHPSQPTHSPHDNNACTLDLIDDRHIVIVCLPNRRHGITPLAGVTKGLLRSLYFIRNGQMSGIGGVHRDKHVVKLGDVVVGCVMQVRVA